MKNDCVQASLLGFFDHVKIRTVSVIQGPDKGDETFTSCEIQDHLFGTVQPAAAYQV
jgi:hypothetical protein